VPEAKQLDVRIQECYDTLPPAERRLGDLLLSFPGDIANYSATELAQLAGTSKAAATRFFRRLGYRDFNDARLQIREAQRWGSPLYQSNTDAKTPASNRSRTIESHLERELVNLQRTLEGLSPDTLRSVAAKLATQRRVAVVGYRNSRFIADYFQRQLSLLRANVTLLPAAGQTVAEDLVEMGEGDLLVVIGLRRRVAQLQELMSLSQSLGVPCVLIADKSDTELYKLANWHLICQVQSTSVFDSYTSVMSLLNLLLNLTMHQNTALSYQRLRRIEALHEQLGDLMIAGVHPPYPAGLLDEADDGEDLPPV